MIILIVLNVIFDRLPEIFHELPGRFEFVRKNVHLFMEMVSARFIGPVFCVAGFKPVGVVIADNTLIVLIVQRQ